MLMSAKNNLHESLEGLNSSLAQSDGELLPGVKCPQSGF